MIEIPVHNMQGQQVDSLEVDVQVLGGRVRPQLLKQAYVRYHANRRQGSARTRNRALTEGSTRKLYRQKGTGNARRGAVRTNIMRGGGVAHAKCSKSWRLEMPRKMRRLANRNALLGKVVDGEIKLVDKFSFAKPSTRQFISLLQALGIDRTCLVAVQATTGNEAISARNVPSVNLTHVDQLNVFNLLNHRYLLADKVSLEGWILRRAPEDSAEAG